MIRSASTWSFNVCLNLLKSAGHAVVGTHSDSFERTLSEISPLSDLVFKSHELESMSLDYLSKGIAKAVYTHRDPLDAIVSGMKIFGFSFEGMLEQMTISIRTLDQLVASGTALFVAYEAMMADSVGEINRIARYLGQPITPSVAHWIATRNGREAMKKVADGFDNLPPERVFSAPANWAYDRETLLHRNHIGDSKTGKGIEHLDMAQCDVVHQRFAPSLKRIGRYMWCGTDSRARSFPGDHFQRG
jgi:hypothetical protein